MELMVWEILKTWWWVPAPFIFLWTFKNLYLYWVRWEIYYPKIKWLILEIKPPREILKPFRAMEDICELFWPLWDGANWRERWCEGELHKYPFWFSFELASIEGEIHFYIRIPEDFRDRAEAALYSHYPDAEIFAVDDYTKRVPQDVPNKDWDMLAEDYCLMKPEPYPIKTLAQFFEEKPEVAKEEKRLDPMNSLLEDLARLNPGEQFWWQVVAAPITNHDIPWIDEGRAVADKIARRPAKAKPKSVLGLLIGGIAEELGGKLIMGTEEAQAKAKEKEKALPRAAEEAEERELLLSAKERELLAAVQTKIGKRGFLVWMRIVYLYKRDAKWPGRHKIVRTYVNHFATEALNTIIFWGLARTRVHYWFRERRLNVRKRKLFDKYVRRLPYLFPRMESKPYFPYIWRKRKGTMILNTEELATLFHFPAKVETGVQAAVRPVEARKAGPPPELPTG